MKTAPRHTRSSRPEPSFFGHVFYWTWACIPKHGLPDRSWIVVTIAQFAYFLLPIALCIPFLSDDAVRVLTEANDNLKYLPPATLFLLLGRRNSCIYHKSKYQAIKEYYRQVGPAERIRHKRLCLLFLAITVIVISMEVWLFTRYYDRCISYKCSGEYYSSCRLLSGLAFSLAGVPNPQGQVRWCIRICPNRRLWRRYRLRE